MMMMLITVMLRTIMLTGDEEEEEEEEEEVGAEPRKLCLLLLYRFCMYVNWFGSFSPYRYRLPTKTYKNL